MYLNGYGVQKDYQKATKWFIKAAGQGDATAQCSLGFMYVRGYGVKKSYQKAIEWFTKAADQGYARAQYNLGVMYLNGNGVKKDYQKAVEWFTMAAHQGDAAAENNLALLNSYEQTGRYQSKKGGQSNINLDKQVQADEYFNRKSTQSELLDIIKSLQDVRE